MKVKVTGVKVYSGTIDGKRLNSGKLFTECKIDESRNDPVNTADGLDMQFGHGTFTEEWKVDPKIVRRLLHVPLPFMADMETERVGNGREARELVVDVRPMEAVKAVKAA